MVKLKSLRIICGFAALLFSISSHALPAFARQTGQECAACHIGAFGPQLTAYGIQFKLGGYTATDGQSGHVPLSAMLVGSWTHTKENQSGPAGPNDNSNNNWSVQEASVFIAGAISDHIGSFVQSTYSDIDKKNTLDNADIRYALPLHLFGADSIAGISINNNPTIQDPFNTLPAWRFPYMASELVPGSTTATLLEGGLEHQVVGASAYTYWNNSIYAELGAYRSLSHAALDKLNIGDDAGELSRTAPYWRIAYFKPLKTSAYSIGIVGLNASLQPDRASGPADKYDDVGIDGSYQYLGNREHIVAFNGSYIRERRQLRASVNNGDADNIHGNVNSLNLSTSYHYRQTYGLTLGYFATRGDSDSTLYAFGDADTGSRNGKPDTAGTIIQADWTPFGKEN
ncbi:MAG TPA: hypothetical protein VGK97_05450, partial [Spongiibacteraceae bacterium]